MAARTTLEAREARLLDRLALAALLLGVLLRVLAPLVMDLGEDANEYVAMGHAWMRHHAFLLPYGAETPVFEPAYSHHYPPAWPFLLGVVFTLFGYGLAQVKAAALVVSLLSLLVVYATTRDLYGKRPALLVTSLVALNPHLVLITGAGYSENLVVALFALTMWAILRSLRDDRWILLAGLFAGLAYLSRASVGYFFIVAGLGGLAWRLHFRGWRVLLNPWYVGAIALFGACVAWWAGRNLLLFGWPHWQTSAYLSKATAYALDHPGLLAQALVAKLPFFALLLLLYLLPFLPQARASVAKIRDEHVSALWLSVALLWLLGWLIASLFWPYERQPLWWADNHRYVVIGAVPLLWAIFREISSASVALPRWGVAAALLLVLNAPPLLDPHQDARIAAVEHVGPYMREGDVLMLAGTVGRYSVYAYLPDPLGLTLTRGENGTTPAFVLLSDVGGRPAGNYTLVGTWQGESVGGRPSVTRMWARGDVIEARAIPLKDAG